MTSKDREFAITRIKEELQLNINRLYKKLDNIDSGKIKDFAEELELDGIRFCQKCGKPFSEGYVTPDMEVFCSLECLEMTEEEIDEQYSDEEDCIFYTKWEI